MEELVRILVVKAELKQLEDFLVLKKQPEALLQAASALLEPLCSR